MAQGTVNIASSVLVRTPSSPKVTYLCYRWGLPNRYTYPVAQP